MDRGEAAPERAPLPWRHAVVLPLWWITLLLLYLANTRTDRPWDATGTDVLVRLLLMRGVMPELALGLALAALVLVLAGGVLGVAALGRRLCADSQDAAGEAFRWGLKAPGRRWWSLLALWPVVGAAEVFEAHYLLLAVMFAVVAFAMAAPFLAGRREGLQGTAQAWRFRWDWPGWPVLGTFLALRAVDRVAEFALGIGVGPAGGLPDALRYALMVAGGLSLAWLSTWLGATGDGVWIDRAATGQPLRAVMRAASRWGVIGPYLALQARWLWWSLMLMPVLGLATIFLIYDAHSLREIHGDAFPHLVMRWMGPLSKAWWVLIAPLALPVTLMTRRLWVSLHPDPPR